MTHTERMHRLVVCDTRLTKTLLLAVAYCGFLLTVGCKICYAQSVGSILLYRPTNFYFDHRVAKVFLDDTLLVEVRHGEAIQIAISPGPHHVQTKSSSIVVSVPETGICHVRVFFELDLLFGKARVLEVTKETAASESGSLRAQTIAPSELHCSVPQKDKWRICTEHLDAFGKRTRIRDSHFHRETFVTWRAWNYPGNLIAKDGCTLTCADSGACAIVPGSLLNGLYALRNRKGHVRTTYLFQQGRLREMVEFHPRSAAIQSRFIYSPDAWEVSDGVKIQGQIFDRRTGNVQYQYRWSLQEGVWIRRRIL